MATVEDLIEELFSDDEIKNTLRTSGDNSQTSHLVSKAERNAKSTKHDWDDDSDDNTKRDLELRTHDEPLLPSRHEFDDVDSNICKRDIASNTSNKKLIKTNANVFDDKTLRGQDVMYSRNGHCTFDNFKQKNSCNFDSDSECECSEENKASLFTKDTLHSDKTYSEIHNSVSYKNNNSSCQPTATLHTSHWDEEELEEQENGRRHNADDDKESLSCSDKYAIMFTVPFPPSPPSEVSASAKCVNRCYVTSMPSTPFKKHGYPTVMQLRALINTTRATYAQQRDKERLIARNAFYMVYPRWGNGCCDKSLMDGNGYGGCPFILCLRCNYGVIRLQDAEWCDNNGRIDLYLTTRNYYPDWSRLASTSAVGVEPEHADSTNTIHHHSNDCSTLEHTEKFVLKQSVQCAAYCCQCSWLTVKSERACIEIKLTDAIAYKYDDAHLTHHKRSLFATVLPLPAGETRRPPLWVCRGHITTVESEYPFNFQESHKFLLE